MGSTGSKAEPTTQAVPSQEDYEANTRIHGHCNYLPVFNKKITK